jgi:L-rhamnose mutarotase
MKILLAALVLLPLMAISQALAADADTRLFEMRTYYANPGKLEALHARFRDHTCKLFEKHGITNIGYWVPLENPDNKLIYIVAYPDRKAREASWKTFLADKTWIEAKKNSEKDGGLVAKAESLYLTAADYSPKIAPGASGERIFEYRHYTATPGNLDRLHQRFREHTAKLFEKHGMTNIAYFVTDKGQKETDTVLFYLLAHKSVDAAKASFDAFRKDPKWLEARAASEKAGGGSLTIEGGVKSIYMKATDYSPIK